MTRTEKRCVAPGRASGGVRQTIVKKAILPLLLLGLTTACSQMPGEKPAHADRRPQISFKTDSERALAARIELDGQDAGPLSDYLDGAAAIRLRPGSHVLRVWRGSEILLNERLYLVDGAQRTFLIR